MASAVESLEMCALDRPASRRFYVHVGSFAFLVAAQPTFFAEVGYALALSGASRALDQVVQDWAMFSSSEIAQSLAKAADTIHSRAAEALQTAFQCIVQLVPSRFGTTDLLLGARERIDAWCYEDGYLTYATDEDAARIMYSETGSLRKLRSEIRRSPGFDPALEMISGPSLFLFDQRFKTGPKTALLYRRQSARLLRGFRRTSIPTGLHDPQLIRDLDECVGPSARTFEGDSVIDCCLGRADLMVTTLLRGLSSMLAGADSAANNRTSGVAAGAGMPTITT